jgi:S-ribosylhomocysteine lyase LuxS involved in autoinducer biosynthesis
MTTLAISAPQPNAGTMTCAGLTSISSLLAGSMFWVKSTAAKLVAAPLAAQTGADLLARLAESGALLEST